MGGRGRGSGRRGGGGKGGRTGGGNGVICHDDEGDDFRAFERTTSTIFNIDLDLDHASFCFRQVAGPV